MFKELLYKIGAPVDRWMSERNAGELLSTGVLAPDFEAATQHGNKVRLRDFQGKIVVLWFFPRADTAGCTLEACAFRDRNQYFEEQNAVVLGVSFDGVEANKKFSDKYGFPFVILCDADRKIGLAYGACKSDSAPVASRIGYVIDAEGKILKVYPNVNAARFPEQALNDLNTNP